VYRLRTLGGREVTATGEHPVLTPAGWRQLIALRHRDRIDSTSSNGPKPEATLEWDEVISLEPAGVRETYDLEIEGDHNFLANDLIVHNSHSSSFALLAYASAYLKAHHGPAFYAALLNNQPMGFYHPASLVKDDPVIYEHLGEIYLKQNRLPDAREAWIHSLELDPSNVKLVERFQAQGFGDPTAEERVRQAKQRVSQRASSPQTPLQAIP
jgi:hypothetical protein